MAARSTRPGSVARAKRSDRWNRQASRSNPVVAARLQHIVRCRARTRVPCYARRGVRAGIRPFQYTLPAGYRTRLRTRPVRGTGVDSSPSRSPSSVRHAGAHVNRDAPGFTDSLRLQSILRCGGVAPLSVLRVVDRARGGGTPTWPLLEEHPPNSHGRDPPRAACAARRTSSENFLRIGGLAVLRAGPLSAALARRPRSPAPSRMEPFAIATR